MKLGIITNPMSARNKRRRDRPGAGLSAEPDVVHEKLETIADMRPILESFAARDVAIVVLDGGDGTIQAALSVLLNQPIFERVPPLALISSGMTNAIATDVGLGGPPDKAVANLLALARRGSIEDRIVERNVIGLSHTQDGGAVYGMFFATGAVYRAIQMCRRAVHPLGIRSSAAIGLTLARVLGRRILFRSGDDEIFCGDPIAFDWDGGERQSGDQLFVLASTLNRFPLGIRPFWGEGPGGLRVTRVAFPPRRFVRSVLPLLYGGARRKLVAEQYGSRNISRVSIHMSCPFALDGEIFQPTPGIPVTLDAATRVRFVQ